MLDHRFILSVGVMTALLVATPVFAQFNSGSGGGGGSGSITQGGSSTGASGSSVVVSPDGTSTTEGPRVDFDNGISIGQPYSNPAIAPGLHPTGAVFLGDGKTSGLVGVKVFGHFGQNVVPKLLDRQGYYAVRYLGQSPIVLWNDMYLNLESGIAPSRWEGGYLGLPGRPVWGLLFAPRCDSYSHWLNKVGKPAALRLAERRKFCLDNEYHDADPGTSHSAKKYSINQGVSRQKAGLAPPPGDTAPQAPGAPPGDDLAALEEDRCRALAQSFFETRDEFLRSEMKGHLVDCIDRVAAPGGGDD